MSKLLVLLLVVLAFACYASAQDETFTFGKYSWSGQRAKTLNIIQNQLGARVTTYDSHACSQTGKKNCPLDSCDLWATGTRYAQDNRQKQAPNDLAAYLTSHLDELGLSYVIWAQRIWVRGASAWRPMEDRGGITANHWDHVHITFRESTSGGGNNGGSVEAPDARCKAVKGNCQTTCSNGTFRKNLCPGSAAVRCCIPNTPTPSQDPVPTPQPTPTPTPTPTPDPTPSPDNGGLRGRINSARDWLKSKWPFTRNEADLDEAEFEVDDAEIEQETEADLDEANVEQSDYDEADLEQVDY